MTNNPQLEGQFAEAMVRIYDRAKRECNYNATRFLQMLNDHGALPTARMLLSATGPSDGFTARWELKRLDLTVEAHVIKPEFSSHFTEGERISAEERLRE
jgi:hypothetical protein